MDLNDIYNFGVQAFKYCTLGGIGYLTFIVGGSLLQARGPRILSQGELEKVMFEEAGRLGLSPYRVECYYDKTPFDMVVEQDYERIMDEYFPDFRGQENSGTLLISRTGEVLDFDNKYQVCREIWKKEGKWRAISTLVEEKNLHIPGCVTKHPFEEKYLMFIGDHPLAAKRGVIRHELYHVKKGHCDEDPSIVDSLKYFLIQEPQAIMYGAFGIKL